MEEFTQAFTLLPDDHNNRKRDPLWKFPGKLYSPQQCYEAFNELAEISNKQKLEQLINQVSDEQARQAYIHLLEINGGCVVPDMFNNELPIDDDHYMQEYEKFQIEYLKTYVVPKMTKEDLWEILINCENLYGLGHETTKECIDQIERFLN